jgi:fatty-acyl-CoA synthase
MNNQGIGSWISRRARMTPWKTALIDGDSKWTYAELDRRINRLAHGFRSLGVQKGDRIAYLNINHSSYIETLFACGLVGAIFVPLNRHLVPENVEYILEKADCRILLFGSSVKNTVENLKGNAREKSYICLDEDSIDVLTLKALIADKPDTPIDEEVFPEDTAIISFTSGTTGNPKGVMLSHNNLSWNVFNLMSCSDFVSDDKILVNAPLNRMGALGVTVLPGIFKGATLVISAERDIKKTAHLIEHQKISVLFGGPDFYKSLDDFLNENGTDFSAIRFGIVGGDVVPPTLVQRWLDRGVQIQQGYGLTEASPVAMLLDKDELLSKNGSAGRPVFFTHLRIVSPEFNDAGNGESGEIILKGPNITKGYWQDKTMTNRRISEDGWLHTGDAARRDHDNHVYILGRLNDAILLDDRIVYPSEIEGLIEDQSGVLECAAIGINGTENDQIALFIVPQDNTTGSKSSLLKLLSGKLPESLMPQSIRFVDSLPKNANGKVLRHKLREVYHQLEVSVTV